MEKTEKPGDLSVPRKTLKLKSPVARPAPTSKPVAPTAAAGTVPGTAKPAPVTPRGAPPRGAPRSHEAVNWADEHKRRMQADMDALGAGVGAKPGEGKGGR
ncbi:MAG: hypothetical protein QOD56_2179 [Gammaproteobacteria bacterium]|nr:hypothetical protein [Gammaproteobacteria bacterium]